MFYAYDLVLCGELEVIVRMMIEHFVEVCKRSGRRKIVYESKVGIREARIFMRGQCGWKEVIVAYLGEKCFGIYFR